MVGTGCVSSPRTGTDLWLVPSGLPDGPYFLSRTGSVFTAAKMPSGAGVELHSVGVVRTTLLSAFALKTSRYPFQVNWKAKEGH